MLANNGIKKLMEIGVGGGNHLAWLNDFQAEIFGLDKVQKMWKEITNKQHDDDVVTRQIVNAVEAWHNQLFFF